MDFSLRCRNTVKIVIKVVPTKITIFLLVLFPLLSVAENTVRLRLATTTSTENTGLLTVLHTPFIADSGIHIDVIAVGTGKALRLGQNGDVDVLMVHAPEAEREFVAAGYGIERLSLMHNDFILLGAHTDRARVRTAGDIITVMHRIAEGLSAFVSRGDESGTHKKEMQLWRQAELQPAGDWYLSIGQGMGVALQIADQKGAYVLSDRGTWLAFAGKLTELVPVYQNDPALFNPYHLIIVNPQRHPHVHYAEAQRYVNYLRSEKGQRIIAEFRKNGEVLFTPDVLPISAE